MEAGIGGLFAGAALYQFGIAFFIPWVLSLLHGAFAGTGKSGRGGSGEEAPLLPAAGEAAPSEEAGGGGAPAASGAAAAAPAAAALPPPARSYSTLAPGAAGGEPSSYSQAYHAREVARLRACIEDYRAQVTSLRAAAQAAADGPGFAVATQAQDSKTAALNALWDRADFLKACNETNVSLVVLCDDALADGFSGGAGDTGPALASGMQAFFQACAAAALAHCAAAADASGAEEGPTLGAEEGGKVAIALALADRDALLQVAQACSSLWLAQQCRQPQVVPSHLETAATREALKGLALLTVQCTLWPLATDSNLAWVQSAEGQALDNDLHQLFSLDGSTLKAGTPVLPIGPSLQARTPSTGGGGATEQQCAELRGNRCRTVVVKA